MARFAWKGRNTRGELVSGVDHAADQEAVADLLVAGGLTPVGIELLADDTDASGTAGWLQQLRQRPVTREDVMILARQMATLHRAGVPLLRSLAGLQASTPKATLIALLADVRASLDQGRDLASAMARHPKVFTAYHVAVIRVGEMTGNLAEAFARIADHVAFEIDIRARISQALRYPTMVLAAIAIALVVINLFVIPTFAGVFAGFRAQLPLPTRVLLAVSAFSVAWWPALMAVAVAAAWGVRVWVGTPDGRYRWDKAKLRMPIAGEIVLKATLARFARGFAIASRSGIPITTGLAVVSQTVDNAFVGQRVEQMREGIERGESLARAAAATGVFTPVVLQMLAVGEESGELDSLLTEVAGLYERETDHAIKGLSSAIEPIMLSIIGAMVLLLALGVFLPLWNLSQVASGRG